MTVTTIDSGYKFQERVDIERVVINTSIQRNFSFLSERVGA